MSFIAGERYTRKQVFAAYGIESHNISQTHRHLMRSMVTLGTDTWIFMTRGAYEDDCQIPIPGGFYFVWVVDSGRKIEPAIGLHLHVMVRNHAGAPFVYAGISTPAMGPFPVGTGDVALHFSVI